MTFIYKDNNYMSIVKNILDNNHFTDIKNCRHHGHSRFDHSIKVSYFAYKIARFLKLDYESTAKAGLLHDFFITSNDATAIDTIISNFRHAKEALDNASKYYNLSLIEEDIIITHMFPINFTPPKYFESWIVSTVDKAVAIHEYYLLFKLKVRFAANILTFFFFNFLK